jgi:hypothetical protein
MDIPTQPPLIGLVEMFSGSAPSPRWGGSRQALERLPQPPVRPGRVQGRRDQQAVLRSWDSLAAYPSWSEPIEPPVTSGCVACVACVVFGPFGPFGFFVEASPPDAGSCFGALPSEVSIASATFCWISSAFGS